jgi:hypothetical protein
VARSLLAGELLHLPDKPAGVENQQGLPLCFFYLPLFRRLDTRGWTDEEEEGTTQGGPQETPDAEQDSASEVTLAFWATVGAAGNLGGGAGSGVGGARVGGVGG